MAVAQSLSIGSQIVRSKIIAATLGAPGIAMLGFMNSYAGNITSISGWGLSSSGVRMMASAESGDRPAIASAVITFGRWLSFVGIALAVLTCWPMCQVTFGTGSLFFEFAVVGLAAPFLVMGSVFVAMLQVEGDFRSIAIAQSVGAITGLLLGGLLIFFLGTLGVALAILVAAAPDQHNVARANGTVVLAVTRLHKARRRLHVSG
jgi:O-antigen/teichoic acid export membrane protein